jgi:hypothetical protein
MKFIYADSLDYVDPDFDFLRDRNGAGRVAHADDEFPHEFLATAPYDGILVSRGIVGDSKKSGKYRESQLMRFRREGGRHFLRYPESKYPGSMLFGDNGAFSYRDQKEPLYGVEDTVDFYEDGGFTHGCSVDHLIFDFDKGAGRKTNEVPADIKYRYEITLSNATEFIKASKRLGRGFTPLGVIQGWSATSMGWAALKLVQMGYTYLAVGGLVPLTVSEIHRALAGIREAIPAKIKLHLLGFGKIEHIDEFEQYGVASFDTTSPLLRAFKDSRKNYFARSNEGELSFYTAIRVPQAIENDKLKQKAMEGSLNQEDSKNLEAKALKALRAYADHKMPIESTLDHVMTYWQALNWGDAADGTKAQPQVIKYREVYRRTLADRQWERCPCRVCTEGGIEAVIFRSSNRNKRRGMHNLYVFYKHLQEHIDSLSRPQQIISKPQPISPAKTKAGRKLTVSHG